MSHISPDDVVPTLRHSVIFSGTPQGLGDGLLSVTNITNGEELRLRGFEYSLARMLDGHRTAREVVDAAARLGLPLTLGGLEGFVKKLESFDLLDGSPEDSAERSPWNPREQWDEQTRAQFREALREGRTRASASFPGVFRETERNWLDQASADELGAVMPGWLSARSVVVFWGLVAAGVLALLGATLVPLPHTVFASAVLAPVSSARVTAPRTGTVAAVQVRVGQRIPRQQVLFTYDVNPTVAALEQAVARVDKQRRELDALLNRDPATDEARARVSQAELDVARTEETLNEARLASGDPFSGLVLPAQMAFNRALDELHKAQMALAAKEPLQQRATLRRLENEVRQLELELVDSEVRAPQGGEVADVGVVAGSVVFRGTDAVRIDESSRLKVLVSLTPEETAGLELGQQARVVSRGRAAPATVIHIDGPNLELELDNPARAFQPGEASVQIRGRPRPLLQLR